MTDFRETPGTPEDVAARAEEARRVHPVGSDRYQLGCDVRDLLLALASQRATIERLERALEVLARHVNPLTTIAWYPESEAVNAALRVAALSPTTASATTGEVGE